MSKPLEMHANLWKLTQQLLHEKPRGKQWDMVLKGLTDCIMLTDIFLII